ncbi:MAG: ATP-binding cassette domain-containing protein [Actinomycetota bacterium]|nr:ATP-binding cassette domain-containing protein [Actinomycetota bacterium]
MPAPGSHDALLCLTDIVKTYSGVRALSGVSFDVRSGEVHALLGENGAGKSTLMAVAAGALAPDSGTVEIGGRRLERPVPSDAQSLGLSVVYQHPSVLDDLTVAENLLFALAPDRRPAHRSRAAWAREQLRVVGCDADPSARAGELSVADRQLLEIAKALALDAKVLVLDEPTESLTAAEADRLIAQVHAVRARGAAVVYISHRLPEVRRIADRITVLRDGSVSGTVLADEVRDDEILQMIVGRPMSQTFPEKPPRPSEPLAPHFVASGLRGHRLRDVTVDVAPGEIVGLAGVEGNGQREALRALAGLLPLRGEVEIGGVRADTRTPRRSRRAGIFYLPHDRHGEGIFGALSVRENLTALVLRELARGGTVRSRHETRTASTQVDAFAVKTASLESPVSTLSGGNQQKVVIARTFLARPKVLLFDEPTRGVDVGARMEIYRLLRQAADEGRSVIVASSDAVELEGLCDKVLVFSRGQVVRVLTGPEITESNITGAAITATVEHTADPSDARSARPRRRRFAAFARSDLAPSGVIALIIAALAVATDVGHPLFLGTRDVTSMLLLASILAFASMGQLVVLLGASLDLSVGPLVGLTVVILSFFATPGAGYGGLALGVLVAGAVGVAVGATNTFLIRTLRIGPVISTLVTYIALQGVSLLLRPQPAGPLGSGVTTGIQQAFGPIPVVFVVAVVVALVADRFLHRHHLGSELRAVGSDEVRAFRVGARVAPTLLAAHVVCALLAVAAGVVLASQVGIGDPSLGTDYTLTSLAAAVLGGASIFGGRGSFVGAFLGALLLQEVINTTTFLGLAQAWQEYLPGLLIVLGAGVYSRMRSAAVSRSGSTT